MADEPAKTMRVYLRAEGVQEFDDVVSVTLDREFVRLNGKNGFLAIFATALVERVVPKDVRSRKLTYAEALKDEEKPA